MHDVQVMPGPFNGWYWFCALHGRGFTLWADQSLAAYDALGHVAHHHTTPLPSEA